MVALDKTITAVTRWS